MDFAELVIQHRGLILAELPATDPWKRLPPDDEAADLSLGVRGDGSPLFRLGEGRVYSWDAEAGAAIVLDFGPEGDSAGHRDGVCGRLCRSSRWPTPSSCLA